MESRKVFFVAQVLTIFQDMNVLPNDWDVAATKKTFYIVYLPLCCVVFVQSNHTKQMVASFKMDRQPRQTEKKQETIILGSIMLLVGKAAGYPAFGFSGAAGCGRGGSQIYKALR